MPDFNISPCFWFNGNAEEAVEFYLSVFCDSEIVSVTRYGEEAPLPAGTPMTIRFAIQGRNYMAINGGAHFQFSPAISMMAHCDSQEELDDLWNKLSDGGTTQSCGWLTDRFGVSWQIVPTVLDELMQLPEEKSSKVMTALWGMGKLDISTLKAAAK